MILGIEASNIRAGGGLTHLTEIINNIEDKELLFDKVVVWASRPTLSNLPDKKWLVKISNKMIDRSFFTALMWQVFCLKNEAHIYGCSIIFAPGSTFLSGFHPFVALSQNMLPFEFNELFRFKSWSTRLRFLSLHVTQSFTFKRANANIFLTKYAKEYISNALKIEHKESITIPHGINSIFLNQPKIQKVATNYNNLNPYRLLYVSIVTVYKHQWNVIKAVSKLRKKGVPIVLDLVGPKSEEGNRKLNAVLDVEDPKGNFVFYHGKANKDELKNFYHQADAFVFASSCENMPIILIEAMTAGLPIACSDRGPMPEVLEENGFYFNPEDVDSISEALLKMIENPKLRHDMSNRMINEVKDYTWKECSVNTFKYLHQIAVNNQKS